DREPARDTADPRRAGRAERRLVPRQGAADAGRRLLADRRLLQPAELSPVCPSPRPIPRAVRAAELPAILRPLSVRMSRHVPVEARGMARERDRPAGGAPLGLRIRLLGGFRV